MLNDDSGSQGEYFGNLYKRRGGFGKHMPNAWQFRRFSMRDGVMFYYDGEDKQPRGKIDLKIENCGFQYGIYIEGAPTAYTMQIAPGGWDEKWKLCADSQEELNTWVAMIERSINDSVKRPVINPLKEYIGSDDENDEEDTRVRRGSIPPAPKNGNASIESKPSSDGISPIKSTPTVDAKATPSTENVSKQVDRSAPAPVPVAATTQSIADTSVSTPTITKANTGLEVKKGKSQTGNQKKLKLKTESSADSDQEELIMTIAICNLCVFFSWYAGSMINTIVLVLIGNFVVFNTLTLRSNRKTPPPAPTVKEEIVSNSLRSSVSVSEVVQVSLTKETKAVSDVATTAPAAIVIQTQSSAEMSVNSTESVVTSPSPPAVGEQGNLLTPFGETFPKVTSMPPDVPDHTWNICDHSSFNVRVGPDYNRYKKKGPSDRPLYDAIGVDAFCAKTRIDHIGTHLKLPDTSDVNTNHPFVPALLIVQIQIPSDSPPLFGSIEDGPGWAIVMYFKIAEHTCEQLKDLSTASPAVRLFAQYCKNAETDPAWRSRFKVINYCSNLEEMGVPAVIMSYNAKPVLIRRTGSIFRGKNYLEIDVHVHKFANLAKKSIHALSSRCGLMYMSIGFVVEGREDDELPEVLFACVGVNRPQEDKAEFLLDAPDDDDA